MNSPLRSALLGGVAVLSLSFGAAYAAATAPEAPKAAVEKRVVIVRSENGQTTTYDSAKDGDMAFAMDDADHGGPGKMRFVMRDGGHHDPEHAAKHLREVLQLTPAQEPALQAFIASMKPADHDGHEHGGMEMHRFEMAKGPDGKVDTTKVRAEAEKMRDEMKAHRAQMETKRAEEAAMTTPQRLDMMVKHSSEQMARRQAAMQSHVNAVKSFYAALTASQQKAFDALHQGGMMGGMGHDEFGEPGMRMRVMHMGEMAPLPPLPPLPPMPPMPPMPPRGD